MGTRLLGAKMETRVETSASTKWNVKALGELCRGKRAYAVIVLCTTTAIALPAQTFTTLFSFNITDGELTEGALVQAADGNLYGTTYWGGAPSDFCDIGCGTIFRITSGGTLTTLYPCCPHRGGTDGG